MIWGKTDKQRKEIQDQKDRNWFAWRPIHLVDGRWCWLQRVSREFWVTWGGSGYNYFEKKA